MAAADPLSAAFAALADPTRRDILVRLKSGPRTVSDLASHYTMTRPAVSQHLSVLEAAGFVARDRRAQWRECRLLPEGLDEAAAWVARQRVEWTERFDLLDEHFARRRTAAGRSDEDRTDEEGEEP